MNLDEETRTMLRDRAEGVAAATEVPEGTVRRTQMRKALSVGGTLAVVAAIAVAGAFLVDSRFSTDAAPVQPAGQPKVAETTDEPSPRTTAEDITTIAAFDPLEPGTYTIDPDRDPSTPLRVEYEIADTGWEQWDGAVKFSGEDGHVAATIVTVTNLVNHGCRDHSPADPRVGPTVENLATALAELKPFQVTSPPADVTMYGYRGKHLELTVPDLPAEDRGNDLLFFTECDRGQLHSWIAQDPVDGFYGYSGPGYTEEFWILDVEGTRLVIAAERSPDRPQKDLAELRAILDSIQIEP
jgi:hypothetical protein